MDILNSRHDVLKGCYSSLQYEALSRTNTAYNIRTKKVLFKTVIESETRHTAPTGTERVVVGKYSTASPSFSTQCGRTVGYSNASEMGSLLHHTNTGELYLS